MMTFECEKCKADVDYRGRVQILDNAGFTHTFCKACGKEHQEKIEKSNASIAETGKHGHLSGQMGKPSGGFGGMFSGKP